MSIIAWDRKIIAADKMSEYCGLATQVTKLRISKNRNAIIGFTGGYENGLGLIEWFENGENAKDWPDWQKSEDWCRFIVAVSNHVYSYEKLPYAQGNDNPFMAWGSGRDYALGAMAQGANAIEAVKIACNFCVSCGLGVDAFELATMKRII